MNGRDIRGDIPDWLLPTNKDLEYLPLLKLEKKKSQYMYKIIADLECLHFKWIKIN